jgi:hypothetical protein
MVCKFFTYFDHIDEALNIFHMDLENLMALNASNFHELSNLNFFLHSHIALNEVFFSNWAFFAAPAYYQTYVDQFYTDYVKHDHLDSFGFIFSEADIEAEKQ